MHRAWHCASTLKFSPFDIQALTHKNSANYVVLLNSTNDTLVRVIETGLIVELIIIS